MLTLGAILTGASLLLHALSGLWSGNKTMDTVVKAVDTGAAITGGASQAATRPTTQVPAPTVTYRPDGTKIVDHRVR